MPPPRQPLHTVYVGAHRFDAGLVQRWRQQALDALAEFAPDGAALTAATGLVAPEELAAAAYACVLQRLERQPVEDVRVDFEDGYGQRPDAEQDGHATAAGDALAALLARDDGPTSVGLRIAGLSGAPIGEVPPRGLRTLELLLHALLARRGELPDAFVVTLPKVLAGAQVMTLVEALDELEQRRKLPRGAIGVELMVEHTGTLIDGQGRVPLPRFVAAAAGRCRAVHLGTFDLTASARVAAPHQHLAHPVCDGARSLMQLSLSHLGTWLCDGSTHRLPVPVHVAPAGGRVSDGQWQENRAAVHGAWALHARHVTAASEQGLPQGWDLHPAQVPVRLFALALFHRRPLPSVLARLSALLASPDGTAFAGGVADDPATGQALLAFLREGVERGFVSEAEALSCGLTAAELHAPLFADVLAGRRG